MAYDGIISNFKNILEPLLDHGWQFTKEDSTTLQMNKIYSELEEISIQLSNKYIHISLPIKNSKYSYYKRHDNVADSIDFIDNYISDIVL